MSGVSGAPGDPPREARPYRMSKRAELVDETRQRIVDATVRLHQSIGLRATTVAAVAAEAGVTRLTVYRHFPDEQTLVAACSSHWLSTQRLPDPAAWGRIADPEARLRTGLADIYRFYRAGHDMLQHVYADLDVLPDPIRRRIEERDAAFADVLIAPFRPGRRRRLTRAVLAHVIAYATWRSLCAEHGVSDAEAVRIMSALVMTVSAGGVR